MTSSQQVVAPGELAAVRLEAFRSRTRALLGPLGDDDLHLQHDPLMSPLVWDVGHVANFEEMWLLREVGGRPPRDPGLDRLYDPVEQPRRVRGGLALPDRVQAFAYMDDVRAEVLDALSLLGPEAFGGDVPLLRDGFLVAMVAQHEAQHQETMLQALDLRSDLVPYAPATDRRQFAPRPVDDTDRVVVPAGSFTAGTDDTATAYDNERPAHTVDLPAFAIDRFPVSARRYAEFIAAGGYEHPEWWSGAGWRWNDEHGCGAPQGWIPDGDGGWLVRRLGHLEALDTRSVVQHVSYWEAEAFAAWAGGRLPTEMEWEKAARWDAVAGRSRTFPWGDERPTTERANVDVGGWGTAPVGSFPAGASAYGVEQLVGDVYEWTSSDFTGYPGYVSFPYEEYSEVFFGEEYKVLRGSSWATASLTARASFRNWDYPQRRQIFSGIRVAYDLADRLSVGEGTS